MPDRTLSPDEYARLERYRYVADPSSKWVCTGESFGRFNYALRDEVYPHDKPFIPVRNRFGGVDYRENPNYKPKKK